MSEYQYYEFRAIDRPLGEPEMKALRACSSRATITPTSFVNHYDWGDLKADPATWMERYFDAFLYLANWGTREVMFRLPLAALEPQVAATYCHGRAAKTWVKDGILVLSFLSDEEPGDDWDDGSGWLSSLAPLRTEIAAGDHRGLYLAWLLCVQAEEIDAYATEPPVPPGLSALSPALKAFAEFLRIDGDLIAVAAERGAAIDEEVFSRELRDWITALPPEDKTALLLNAVEGNGVEVRGELLRRFRCARPQACDGDPSAARSVAELTASAERIAVERERREADEKAREHARREREAAARRKCYLDELAGRETEVWCEVETLIATRQPGQYDAAVRLLGDLRDLALRDDRKEQAEERIRALRQQHARKTSFLARLHAAGLD